ncbi:MAG: LysE family translocator [Gammaproteobacteria bacterium]|nr:LysE family translocator [Gammaproteobacteria bacterium]
MYWSEFITIAIAHLFAVASPGPDFVIVTRQSVTGGSKVGFWTSLGVGAGILVHVSYCIIGVAVLLSRSEALFNLMKYLAAAYLCYLGLQSLKTSFDQYSMEEGSLKMNTGFRKAFWTGFLTNGLNPKATLFFLALFTVVIDINTPVLIQVLYGVYLAMATFFWFAMLSLVLGKSIVREFMSRAGPWFERGMGVLLILLAIQIAVLA